MERITAHRNLVKKTDGNRTLGKPRLILADIINVYLQGVYLEVRNGLIWLRIGRGDGLF
jgi:hypothetical protein